jgi:antitoxin component YwqK of YwqJK toxin-antitoxin module
MVTASTFNKISAALAVSILAFSSGCSKPAEVAYKDLDWDNDVYSIAGQRFTGIARESHKNGNPSKEYPMRDGLMHGLMHEWYENGQMSAETHWDSGKRHGLNRYWNDAGKLIKEQVYERGASVSVKEF